MTAKAKSGMAAGLLPILGETASCVRGHTASEGHVDTKAGPGLGGKRVTEHRPQAGRWRAHPLAHALGARIRNTKYFPGQPRLHVLFTVFLRGTRDKSLARPPWFVTLGTEPVVAAEGQLRVTRGSRAGVGERRAEGRARRPAGLGCGAGVRGWGGGPWGAWSEGLGA